MKADMMRNKWILVCLAVVLMGCVMASNCLAARPSKDPCPIARPVDATNTPNLGEPNSADAQQQRAGMSTSQDSGPANHWCEQATVQSDKDGANRDQGIILIQTVVIRVNLDHTLTSGFRWLQALAPGANSNAQNQSFDLLVKTAKAPGAGSQLICISPYQMNTDAVLGHCTSNSREKIVSAPVVLATNETETKIICNHHSFTAGTADCPGKIIREESLQQPYSKITLRPRLSEADDAIHMNLTIVVEAPKPECQEIWPWGMYVDNRPTRATIMTTSISAIDGTTVPLYITNGDYKRIEHKRVPILSSIPLLGRLFRYHTEKRVRADLVTFITPYLIDCPTSSGSTQRGQRYLAGNSR